MNNDKFSALVKEQKQKKLIGVLRDKSRRFLNDMEIESIARSMDADRQYQPCYPWHLRWRDRRMTEKKVKKILSKYLKILTDEPFEIGAVESENGG